MRTRFASLLDHIIGTIRELKQFWVSSTLDESKDQEIPPFTHGFLNHALLTLALLAFWPFWLNLLIALATASGWLFWLVTSICLGSLQVVYASYQFFFIAIDILGLSILKTFATLRGQILQVSFLSGWTKTKRKSRRREWRGMVKGAKSYEEFLHLNIEEPIMKDEPRERKRLLHRFSFSVADAFSRKWKQPNDVDLSNSIPLNSSKSFSHPSSPNKLSIRKNMSYSELHPDEGNATFDQHNGKDETNRNSASPTAPNTSRKTHITHSRSVASLLALSPTREGSHEETEEDKRFKEKIESHLGMAGGMLVTTTRRLKEARLQLKSGGDPSPLKFLLAGVVKRNHLQLDDLLIEEARSIAECGRHHLVAEVRHAIEDFIEEVEQCLECLTESPVYHTYRPKNRDMIPEMYSDKKSSESTEIADRIKHLKKMKLNTGCTALMLSGGGAQAMHHLGTIRSFIISGCYDDIKVISGTSGGSISAAMCAIKKPEELLRDVCVSNVSTDYLLTGRMKKENIRWFPSLLEMGRNWLESRILVDSNFFKRCCDFYYGDVTFEEAFQMTGKHVCISVSASRAGSGDTAQRLLLNHISTPHVTISSAVAASCALPGVMKPTKLMAKDSEGNQVVFEVDGVEWIDGSVQADLPFKRIATMFNVSNFIVAQVNFHVIPFLHKAYHPSTKSLYWKLFQILEWDIRSRALNLARLGLFPRIFGQDVSDVFKQKYHGNITLVPKFTMMQVFGLQILSNPSVQDMELYLESGQKSAWPYLESIKIMLRLEKAIDSCLLSLQDRYRSYPEDLQTGADLDSLSSCSFAVSADQRYGSSRDKELLKLKIKGLEAENAILRKKLKEAEKDWTRITPEPEIF